MQKQIDKELIEDIAIGYGISPSFVEKDLYVVDVLKVISELNFDDANIIFSGGTCLSKAYKKIKRFSEDIDFRINTSHNFTRAEKRNLRAFVITALNTVEEFKVLENTLIKRNESNFFSIDIEYSKSFEINQALRPNLKLEFTFDNVLLSVQKLEVKSIISEFVKDYPSTYIDCISPVETAANKLSALLWRIDIKDRTKKSGGIENDPTIMRHLHDLSALENEVLNSDFITILNSSFEMDKGRHGSNYHRELKEFLKITLDKLIQDKEYKKEYELFVNSMSYAKTAEMITFDSAIKSLAKIIEYVSIANK